MRSTKARLSGTTVAVCFMGAPAVAQLEGKTALVHMGVGNITRNAAIALGMEVRWRTNEAGFLDDLRTGTWDLVALDLPGREVADKATMLSLFEQHLSRGGRLMVNYPELDRWPALQALLGVQTVRDRNVPSDVFQPAPGNPVWGGEDRVNRDSDLWPDNGDDLVPIGGAFIVTRFDSPTTGAVAAVLRNDRGTLVNGFDWDSMDAGSGFLARQGVLYLLGCPQDVERDGSLDIFDFLRFQNLWVQQSALANRNFDGSFDILDFLEFQNEFATGCD